MNYVGKKDNFSLFVNNGVGVIVDEGSKKLTIVQNPSSIIASGGWSSDEKPSRAAVNLATSSFSELDIKVFSNNDRMYTIPKGVVSEAKRGLEWRKEHKRGGTSVGMNTARTLAKGGQIGIKKVRHIAKYFPRHEVDKQGKGYSPGEKGFPSAGRIAWALWGGDSAQRWASAIVEREDKKKKEASLIAYGGYGTPEKVDYDSFDILDSVEFFIRMREDGGGIDRLYRVESDGQCRIWDDGYWDDLGNVAHDFETYDKSLDDPYDKSRKFNVPVDRESAIVIAAMMDSDPLVPVLLRSVNFEETELIEKAIPEADWEFMGMMSEASEEDVEEDIDDDGLTAAGFETDQDGDYTPEERSEKAKQQVRDATGRFAKTGTQVVIGDNPDYQGKIMSVNPDTQEVNVELENGENVAVPANLTKPADEFQPVSQASFPESNLDFTGILGEPRTPIDQPQAQLPGRLPPLTAPDVNLLVNDWTAWVSDQRLAPEYSGAPAKKFVPKELPDPNSVMGKYYKGAFNPDGSPKPEWNPAVASNVYNEPMLRDWLDTRYKNKSGVSGYHNRGWYTPDPSLAPIEEKKSRDEVMSKKYRNMIEDKYDPVNFSITAAGEEEEKTPAQITPENSDVPPMYFAVVAEDDPQAVMELASLVPAGKKTAAPAVFVRQDGKWKPDEGLLNDLQSATPPPIIVLDNEMLSEVLAQIEGEPAGDNKGLVSSIEYDISTMLLSDKKLTALVAKGGLDRNRGNAERLRRYWTIGPGALKIRWNTPGDWTRCYRQLAKYMGPRAKGYCSLRHKEMTGVWPGSKYNVGKKKKGRVGALTAALESVKPEETIINDFTLRARAESARSRVGGGRSKARPEEHGSKFIIPLVIPEMKETGDGRIFKKKSISFRDLPLPLLWQIKTGQGHDGSVVVGQIFSMERTEEGIGNAYGVFDSGEFGREAERLVKNGFIRGVSADMDQFEAEEEELEEETGENGDTNKIQPGRITIKKARVMAVTIVPKPAFQECFIQIVDENTEAQDQEETVVPDGTYVDGVNPQDASALVACGMVAGAVPVEPPKEWFDNPNLKAASPLTVTDEGKVFGHIAAWHVDHIGMSFGTKPPRSRSKYAYFHTGVVRTLEGDDVPVGQLTLAGGHAGLEASAEEAVRHYDDTASAVADVHAGEDAFGIWVAGSLRPNVTPEQVRALRASAPSGDWRPIKGQLELVAVCQVNVPGFPIARARVASGQVMALVAAGAGVLAEMKHDPLAEVIKKVEELEKQPIIAAANEVKQKFSSLSSEIYRERHAELATKMREKVEEDDSVDQDPDDYMNQMFDDDPTSEMSVISRRVRERLAKEGKALDDGSYPIRNVSDLKNAIRAYGRSKPGKRAKVRKHIMRRARGLSRADLIPDNWKTAANLSDFSDLDPNLDLHDRVNAALERMSSLTAAVGEDDGKDEIEEIIEDLTPEEIEAIKQAKRQEGQLPERDEDGRIKFTPETQPRDASGKFRKVLARLKSDLGAAGLQRVVEKVEETENLDSAGNYRKAYDSADDLIGIIDRLDARALNPEALENVREGARELGEVIANLPFAFGEEAEKIRFSDVPPALRKLMEDMVDRVEVKIGKEDADIATEKLRNFMSGGDYFNQGEISSEMSKLLRLLT